MSITWTDSVTPLNAANMNALEQVARKGAANGYASLDATTKVPLAQTPLSPVTNGQWLKGVGGVPVWSAIAAADLPPQAVPGKSTTLPASPTDGQEHILTDSASDPTYQWRFRYNSQSNSTFKWEYIGGTPKHVIGSDNTAWTTSPAGVYLPLPNGPSYAYPRQGEYVLRFGAAFVGNSSGFAGSYTIYFRPMLNTSPNATSLAGFAEVVVTSASGGSNVMGYSIDTIAPGSLSFPAFIGIYSSLAIPQSILQPYFDVEPRRVA